ncbi:MAG: adenylyl-sulfate kinase [Thermoprotei archaeon]|nr:MAG: adenylyl-sulfate kinase [Thermoprotei archaeon]RLF25182.1 MAG: adenylyl-sulfate kinase [Thermoprotei archaeon]
MPFVIWFTGIPASGKSTIAKAVEDRLKRMGLKVERLESDSLRKILTPRPQYTEEERDWFYGVIAWLAYLLYRNDVNVLIDATAHKAMYREKARQLIGKDFIEVYVKCPIEIAMKRDTKGLYKKALEGIIKTLPGLQVPYEEPVSPDIVLDTSVESVEDCAEKVLTLLRRRGYLPNTRLL